MKLLILLFNSIILLRTLAALGSPATNLVYVTPNIKFFLTSFHPFPQSEFRSDEMIHFAVAAEPESRSENPTNAVYCRVFPFKQAYDFRLLDEKGQEIAKTRNGLEYSQPPKLPKNIVEFLKFKPTIVMCNIFPFFRPDEWFKIRKKGIYDLEVRIRIYAPMTNGVLDSATMLDFQKFRKCTEFGMVVSDPVRVKVIKK